MAVHVRYSRPLQNNNVNNQVLRILENMNNGGYFLVVSFRIERWHYLLSLSKF